MTTKLSWSKGIFSVHYKIFDTGKQLGSLTDKPFSRTTKARFNGKEYLFRNTGFFNQYTEITDCSDNRVIGGIHYSSWRSKAVVSVNGRKYSWKYANVWGTQWSLWDSGKACVKFKSSTTKGQIHADTDDGLLVLSGLFISSYYLQAAFIVILLAVIIPAIL